MFDPSQVKVLDAAPFQSDAQGNVTQTMDGVFILLSRALVDQLKTNLSAADKATLEGYVFNVTVDQAGKWHVPVWSGDDHALYIRVPAAIWVDPSTPPPAKVKQFFQWLWREAQPA